MLPEGALVDERARAAHEWERARRRDLAGEPALAKRRGEVGVTLGESRVLGRERWPGGAIGPGHAVHQAVGIAVEAERAAAGRERAQTWAERADVRERSGVFGDDQLLAARDDGARGEHERERAFEAPAREVCVDRHLVVQLEPAGAEGKLVQDDDPTRGGDAAGADDAWRVAGAGIGVGDRIY